MCQSISWSKKGSKLYYLTTDDLETEKGKELMAYTHNPMDDVRGHGALKRYHFGDEAMKGLEDHEMTDFTSPKNFPKEIARAFLAGAFFHEYLFDPNMLSCLDKDAVAELAKKRTKLGRFGKARAAYGKACAAYGKACAAYGKAYAAWSKADAAYGKTDATYGKADAAYLATLIQDPANLNEAWRKFKEGDK